MSPVVIPMKQKFFDCCQYQTINKIASTKWKLVGSAQNLIDKNFNTLYFEDYDTAGNKASDSIV